MLLGLSNHEFSSIGSYPGYSNTSPGESASSIFRMSSLIACMSSLKSTITSSTLLRIYCISVELMFYSKYFDCILDVCFYLECDGIPNSNFLYSSHSIYSQRPHIPNYLSLSSILFTALRLSGRVWISDRTLFLPLIPPIKPGKHKAYSQEDCSH